MVGEAQLHTLVDHHNARAEAAVSDRCRQAAVAFLQCLSTPHEVRRVRVSPDARVCFLFGEPGGRELAVEFWRDGEAVVVYRTPYSVQSRSVYSSREAAASVQSWADRGGR